jgi:hypothetical protein
MDILGNIFSNPLLKKAAFGKLKETMSEHNLKGIFVTMDAAGELDFKFVNNEQELIPAAEFQEMKRVYIEYLKK